ncbi:hypothetical protein E2562_021960 [Oryza meyeriana var. granulata]|uniref:Uncharacterized protein n=1 Tax=Oryza meyeriana var. granulata TaxID=110450 RepID=A0A6G1DLF8_9ORYZ|nr:hypothetical protein E2562_021960 [Oryza meyeriana var. granulata]
MPEATHGSLHLYLQDSPEQAILDYSQSFPKAKKFRNKYFPLFDALGELYDGHTAKGTYNFTSTQPLHYPVLTQVESEDELDNTKTILARLEALVSDNGRPKAMDPLRLKPSKTSEDWRRPTEIGEDGGNEVQ